MSGEMSLWEYGAIVFNWNERQPKDGQSAPAGPVPTEDEQAEMRHMTAITVQAASKAKAEL